MLKDVGGVSGSEGGWSLIEEKRWKLLWEKGDEGL